MRWGRVLVAAVAVVLAGAVAGAAAGQAGDATGATADPGYEVVQCLANPRPILGTAAVYRLLVANHTDGELFVSVPAVDDEVYGPTVFTENVDPCPESSEKDNVYKILVYDRKVAPGETTVFNVPIPVGYSSRSARPVKSRIRVEVHIAEGVVWTGIPKTKTAGIASVSSEASESIMVHHQLSIGSGQDLPAYETRGGKVYVLEGEYEVVAPLQRDMSYFDSYVKPSLASGDCWWTGQSVLRRRRDREVAASAQEPIRESQGSFDAKAATPIFKRFEDNGYFGFWRSLGLLASRRNNLL